MTPRQIEAFRAVMVTGSVTQAAEMLTVSQPAVSRMIADLEREIGFKLFTRANRQLIPTEESRAFFAEVERAFVGLKQIMRSAEAIREYRSGHFRLITIPSLASTVMAELIARFAKLYPAVAVSLEVQPSQRVFEWIVSQQCDLGISTLPIENAAIATRPLTSGAAVCILPEGHRLADRKSIQPRDLEDEAFISFRSDSIFRHLVDEVFRKAGVRRQLKIEARTTEAIHGLVAAGLGVSVIGPVFPRGQIRRGVVPRPFRPPIEIGLTLLYSSHKPLSRIAERFIEIADDHLGPVRKPASKGRKRKAG